MGPSVYVKVVGFRDDERHALNTLFRLSLGRPTSYGLWTPEAPVAPHLALIDLDAYEAGVALASPGLNPKLKMICVGHDAPANAWRTFQRPLHWPEVVKAMDSLFAPVEKLDAGIDFGDGNLGAGVPPGFKVSLLVDPSREDRMYQRARLALAGHTEIDEAVTAADALELARKPLRSGYRWAGCAGYGWLGTDSSTGDAGASHRECDRDHHRQVLAYA